MVVYALVGMCAATFGATAMATSWTRVAGENETITLASTRTVRYGAGASWNEQTLAAGNYSCGNALFGDPISGTVKECDVLDVPPPATQGWTRIAGENEGITLASTRTVRYGAGSSWAQQTLAAGNYSCSNAMFGDPISGTAKECDVLDVPLSSQGWTRIGGENEGFSLTSVRRVRYGAASSWAEQVLAAGNYTCGNAMFGDPLNGTAKECDVLDQGATTSALVSSLNSATVGGSVTFTSTVSPAIPGVSPVGTVTFKDGNSALGSVAVTPSGANGVASFSTTFAAAAAHSIIAVYSGDETHAASTSNVFAQAVAAPSRTWTRIAGENENFTLASPRTVRYGAGSTWIERSLAAGGYACSNGMFGDPIPGVGKECDVLDVAMSAASVVLVASPSPAVANQSVTLSATVAGTSPSGGVTFFDGSTALGTTALLVGSSSSAATLTVPFGSPGSHSLTASYVGDGNNSAASSEATTLQVNPQVVAPPPNDASTYTQTRTSSFEYYGAADGVKNGLLKAETVEPGDSQFCVTTTYVYDAYGNKSGATTANCGGAASNVLFASRSSSSTYAAQTVVVGGVGGVAIPSGTLPTSSTNALGQSDSKSYDPRFGAVVKLTGPNALTTNWALDDFGRVVTESRADGTSTVSYYCFIGGRVSDTTSNSPGCPAPGSAEIPIEAVAYVHKESRDTGGVKNGPFSRVYTDRAGRQLRSVTEAFDGTDQPGGKDRLIVQETVYNIYGNPSIVTQPYFLDTGSSTASGNGGYGMRKTEYDVLGRPVAVYSTDPAATGNQGGSQPSVSFIGGSGRQASVSVVAYAGLNVTSTDDKGNTRLEEKNVDGKVVRVTDALGAQVAYQHDAFGNLLTTKDALQNLVRVAYDLRGRKISMADPDSGVWGYCYDALGQLVAQQNSKMRGADAPGACPLTPNNAGGSVASPVAAWTTMAYDVLGRPKSRVEPEYTSNWSYDNYADGSPCNKGIGKLCEVDSTNGVNRKTVYDGLGRPVNSRTTIANGPSFSSAVGYDGVNGRQNSQTYPTGLQVRYGYTLRGFLTDLTLGTAASVTPLPSTPGATPVPGTTLSSGALLWQASAYNAWGKAEQQTYGNGVSTNAVFEPATGRLTNITAGLGAATNVVNQSYVWDSIGRIAQRNDANGAASDTPALVGAVSDVFAYDAIGRLSTYTVNAPGIPGYGRTVTLQYNALGMTLYKSDVGNYAYGAANAAGVRPHALQSVSGSSSTTSYGYDANGNLANASAGKYSSFSYTSFNLPDSTNGAQGPGGTPKYTWQYDENHQRVKEVEVTSAGTRTTWNMHPDNRGGLGFESESSTASPTPSNRHYLSVGAISIGVLVSNAALPVLANGQLQPPVISGITLVKVEYWHKDQLGSLLATTNHRGDLTKVYSYDPFGKRRQATGTYDGLGNIVIDWTTGTDSGTDRGYTGHEHLDDVGIIHMNGRTYDPTLGRFMQGDPLIQDPLNLQNYDRYGYCYNNPITCSDPSGHGWLSDRWHAVWHNKIVRAVVIIAAAYYTGGYALDLYAQSAAATAGFAAGNAAAAAGLTGAEIAGAESFAAAAAYSAASTSVIGGAVAGASGGFVGSFIGSDGNLKAGLQGALTGAVSGGINNYFGSSYSWNRVGAETLGAGATARLTGGDWRHAMTSQFGISALTFANWSMRKEMIAQSKLNPDNISGNSEGLFHDGYKVGGGRREINPQWYVSGEDASVAKYMPCVAPMGGCQGAPMYDGDDAPRFGSLKYGRGGALDTIVETFAGPHDWFRDVTGSYTPSGNSVAGLGGWDLRWDTAKNFLLVAPAGAFAIPALLTTVPGAARAIGGY